jgi:LysR substrate binding domain
MSAWRLRTAPIGSVDLLWLASPATVATMADVRPPIWSLTNLSPLYRIMKDAIAASDLADCPLNLCNNVRTMIDIVLEGGGIGIFPRPMARQQLAEGRLVPVPGAPLMPPVDFHVAVRAAEADPLVLAIFDRASRLELRGEDEVSYSSPARGGGPLAQRVVEGHSPNSAALNARHHPVLHAPLLIYLGDGTSAPKQPPTCNTGVASLSPQCRLRVASNARDRAPIVARLSLRCRVAGAFPAHWPGITPTTL